MFSLTSSLRRAFSARAVKRRARTSLLLAAFAATPLFTGCAPVQDQLFNIGLAAERSMSGFNLKQIEVADHHWTYLDSYDGELGSEGASDGESATEQNKPVILMLHGFAVDKDNWLRYARHLGDYRLVAPDLPGHGETSYNPDFTYDFAQQALWLNEFINALDLKDVHLVGNSMGGGIALMYSFNHPDNVESITLIDAAGVQPPNPSDLQKILDEGGANPLLVKTHDDFIRLRDFAMVQQPFLPWPADNVLARRTIERAAINDKIFADIHAVAELAKTDDSNLRMLEQIQQPVLILWGEQDRALDVSSVKLFEQYLPNTRSFIFPQVGHAPMLEVPEDSGKLTKDFIDKVESNGIQRLVCE